MGDVQVGADATILAHSVLMPGSRVGKGETWGGVPARPISRKEMEHFKKEIGIRVVNGANSLQIVSLLNRNFLILVAISYLLAIPVAYLALNRCCKTLHIKLN